MENPIRMDDLGVPLFSETSIFCFHVVSFFTIVLHERQTSCKCWCISLIFGLSIKLTFRMSVSLASDSQSTKKREKFITSNSDLWCFAHKLGASKKWGVMQTPRFTVPRFFLEPWDFLAGNGSPKMSVVVFLGGRGSNCYKHEVSFQPDHKLVVRPIYGSPDHQSTKKWTKTHDYKSSKPAGVTILSSKCMITIFQRSETPRAESQSYQVHSGARCLWVFQEFQRYMFYIHLKLKDVLE